MKELVNISCDLNCLHSGEKKHTKKVLPTTIKQNDKKRF